MTKDFVPFSLVLSSVTKLEKQRIRVLKLSWHLLWKFYEHFFGTQNVVEDTSFWKRANFFSFEKNFAFFSRNIEHDKCQGTIHKVPEANLTNILQAIW